MSLPGRAVAGPVLLTCTSARGAHTEGLAVRGLFAVSGSSVSAVSLAVLLRTVPSLVAELIVTVIVAWTWEPAGMLPVEQLIVCPRPQELGGAVAPLTKVMLLNVSPAGRVSVFPYTTLFRSPALL